MSKKRKIESLQRLEKVAYVLSWQSFYPDYLNPSSAFKKMFKRIILGEVNRDDKTAYDCTDYMVNDSSEDNVWEKFWGIENTVLPDFKDGDKFYLIVCTYAVFRMQLRSITLTDIIAEKNDISKYISSRLKQYLTDQEMSRLTQFEETTVVELKF